MTGTDLVHVPGFAAEWAQGARGDTEPEWRGTEGAGHPPGPQRLALVAELLQRQLPYRTIARQLHISKSSVERDVRQIEAHWLERMAASHEKHVAEQLAMLDLLERVAFKVMDRTPATPDLDGWDRILAVRDRRARLLGLDKAQKLEVSGQIDLVAKKARAEELVEQVRKLHAV